MPKFAFEGTTPQGIVIRGAERFPSREDAEVALFRRQLGRLSITEKKSLWRAELLAPRVKRQEVMHLSRQLAAFVRAGLPVLDAVHTIGEEAANSSLRRVMQDVEEGLRSGERLSDCLDRHPKIVPEFYRGILRSAELTGSLDTVLDQLAGYLERDLEARRKIKSALIYPRNCRFPPGSCSGSRTSSVPGGGSSSPCSRPWRWGSASRCGPNAAAASGTACCSRCRSSASPCSSRWWSASAGCSARCWAPV